MAPVRCEVCSLGCPSWLVLLLRSLFVLHQLLRWGGLAACLWPLLRWGGLVACLWPLLLLLCVGLLWGLCCAVLSPWALARPPLQGLRWKVLCFGGPSSWSFSWTLYWGSSLSLPVVTGCSWSFLDIPRLSTLRCLTAGGVTLVFCRGLVGLPYWGCGASGFLGPTGLIVFAMGTPVSGRACGLRQSTIVTKPFPPSGGFGSCPSCGVPYLRLALCSLAVPPSHRLVLLLRPGFLFSGPGLRGRRQPFPSHMYSFGMWSPFGSTVSFCHS